MTDDELAAIRAREAAAIAHARADVSALLEEVTRLRAHAGKAVCAWCGEEDEKTPEAMVAHQMGCEKRTDAVEAQLRAYERRIANLEAALEASATALEEELPLPAALGITDFMREQLKPPPSPAGGEP
jgi:hypothetical protein